MKLIHCADLHLDSKMESIMSTDLARVRKGEILDTFRRMIDYAYLNNINVIMICGDMFDSNKVQTRTKQYIIDLIS
jgi:DNA repair exonuclease SbcCD nuclease subunit